MGTPASISRWLGDAMQDLRYTLRTLRRDAGFTAFAIAIIGLGIGASATIFSVVHMLLIRPLPFEDPARLVWMANSGEGMSGQTLQVAHFLDFREQNKSFEDLAAYFAFYGAGDIKLAGNGGEPERLNLVQVSQNFFPILGIRPQIGRLFNDEECKWNGPNAVVLSHRLWTRRFASDPAILGRKITLNEQPVTVIGVMPESFDFGTIFAPGTRMDLFAPFPLTPETNRWGNTLSVVGRLGPGATLASAQAEARILGQQIEQQHPERNGLRPNLSPLSTHVSGRLRPALLVLVCAVIAVMAIVCANLSNLQLARTAARRKELAVRAALGAGRARLIRQMLTESVVLAGCGAFLGIMLAILGTAVLARLDAINVPLLDRVRVDGWVLAFTAIAAMVTGVVFGIIPALQVSGGLPGALKDSGRGSSQSRRLTSVRNGLVVAEVAFACILLVGAGLLIRSFFRVLDVDLGFRPERAASVRIDPSREYSDQAKQNAYFNEALRRIRSTPGIEAAGLTDVLPLGRNRTWGAGAKGQVYPKGQYPLAFVRVVTDGYFRAMGIPLIAGRDFNERDLPEAERVIIVNRSLAQALWPGEDPLGKLMRGSGNRDNRVIGVVGDVRHLALEREGGNEMYIAMRQTQDRQSIDLVMRTALPQSALARAVREALRPLDPNLPLQEFRTLEQLVDRAVSSRRLIVVLLAGFAGFALILASLGIYAVIAYSVSQRAQEIGIRMALGAPAHSVRSKILWQTLALTGAGLVVGMTAALALGRTMQGLLFGVSPEDPATFTGMLAILILVAAIAGYVPARRASMIDPAVALRSE